MCSQNGKNALILNRTCKPFLIICIERRRIMQKWTSNNQIESYGLNTEPLEIKLTEEKKKERSLEKERKEICM